MITAEINGTKLIIPTSWSDVKYKDFIKFLDCEDSLSQVSCLVGISKESLIKLTSEGLSTIMMAMSFMNTLPEAYFKDLNQIEVAKESYGKLEVAKAALIKAEKPYHALIDILKIYTGTDYSDQPTTIAHPLGAFFLTNYHDFLSDIKG